MIDLYYWPTPNGHKVTLLLEETAMPYTIVPINIAKGEQFKPEFLAISPNNRMPAIVDNSPLERGAPIAVFESGAILLYLAGKSEQFLPNDSRGRVEVTEWLFWQVGGLGPMAGQNHHFTRYAPEKIPYAMERYIKETNRLYGVLNQRLADREFIAGAYSIADMACYPWIVRTNCRVRTWMTSRISNGGSRPSGTGRRRPAPTIAVPTSAHRRNPPRVTSRRAP